MKYLISLLIVLSVGCDGCIIGSDLYAADFDYIDTATVEIWVKYDMGYVADTVRSVVSYKSGNQWYVRTLDGEAWSDREPIKLRRK